MNSLLLRTGIRYLVPLLLTFSVFSLLRGHNEPGGGFIGGLIGASALMTYAISEGVAAARRALRLPPETLSALGLLLALGAGVSPAFVGYDFFEGLWLFIGAEGDDKGLPLSSVLVFDIGVYLVVFGGILALTFELEEVI